ncbi:MAG: mechanosensitive ion channel family protein [Deltaproteobacteria bacterium]
MGNEIAVIQNLYRIVSEFVVNYSFQIIGAIIILLIGLKAASWFAALVVRFGEKKGLDLTLIKFIAGVVKAITIIFVVIIALGKFGISIAPFIAAIGAIAFGGSLAIQGPLSNYGAGIAIILSRQFVVGDTITVKGIYGQVEDIHLAATILTNEDGEKITIPNKHIVGEIFTNSFANRIVESTIGISYADDPQKAVAIIRQILANEKNVASKPPPQVGISEFADSAITIGLRYWVPTVKFFETKFRVNMAIHTGLKEGKITIPVPQRDLHLISKADLISAVATGKGGYCCRPFLLPINS